MTEDEVAALEARLGALHVRQRLGIERDHEVRLAAPGFNPFRPGHWYSIASLIGASLRLAGFYGRARRNAERVELRRNTLALPSLPPRFDGFTILHLSDLHVEISAAAMECVASLLRGLDYDLCVLTGDFRSHTFGPVTEALAGLERLRAALRAPVYAVLGNHDSLAMVPGMTAMGIDVLLNEVVPLMRGEERLYLAGVDDAHYYRLDNIEKAMASVPPGACTILLSHTPEIYRQAAHAGFEAMLSGHTHGGQICLPGAIPVMRQRRLPRRLAAGAWRHGAMAGYTSVGAGTSILPVRLNCPAEITLHRLARRAPS